MAVVSNTFEGGTDGVAVTAPNSGGASGTAFDSMFGTSMLFSAADAFAGSMGAAVAGGAFGAGVYNLGGVTNVAIKMYFKIKAIPTSGDCYLVRLHNGSTRILDVRVQGTGKLRVADFAGTFVTTFANALSTSNWYRLEVYTVAGSTTSNGTIKVAYYIGNNTTPVETAYVNTAANVGAGTNFTNLYMGKYNNAPEAYGFDSFAYDPAASDFIGVGTTTPPTVSTPANQNVAASASVSASVTASSSSGTITSYAWSVIYSSTTTPTLSGASTNTVSFTAGAAGNLYILQCVVTDSNSLTTTVTTEVRVPTNADGFPLPGSPTSTTGSWASIGGAATPGQAISDSSDSTYFESAALNSTAQLARFRWSPVLAKNPASPVLRLSQDTTGSTTVKVRLFEGTTMRQEWTQAVTNAWADYTFNVTSPGSITDWGNLFFEVYATAP